MINKPAARSLPSRILAYLFAGLVILSLPIGVFANQAQRAFSSAEVISEVLSEILLASGGARDMFLDGILSSDRIETLGLGDLDQDNRDEIIGILLPDDWVESQLKASVVEFLSWIESDRVQPNFVLDLTPIKQGLDAGGANRMIEIVFNSWPKCTPSQLIELQAALRDENLPANGICIPEGDIALPLRRLMERELVQQIREIPSQLKLFDELGENQDLVGLKEGIVALLDILRRIRLIPIVFFGLLMAIAIRSLNELGRWWGIPLILGSILGLLIVLLMAAVGPAILEDALASSDAPIAVSAVLQRGVRSIMLRILEAAAWQNIVAILFGAALFGLTRTREKQPKVELPQNNSQVAMEAFPSPPPVKPFRPDETQGSREEEKPPSNLD